MGSFKRPKVAIVNIAMNEGHGPRNTAFELFLAFLCATLMLWSLASLGFLALPILTSSTGPTSAPGFCVVNVNGTDDAAPAIQNAFKQCGQDGTIYFKNQTYHVNTVMNTTGLSNCTVDLRGTLLWSKDIDYWRNHSIRVGYQNQSTAWLFGGDNIYFNGYGYGTFNGNGQVWYDYNAGRSNLPGRPHSIVMRDTTNSVFEGIRFLQSQMWTVTLFQSANVLLQDIFVSSTSNNYYRAPTLNTDGANTIYSNNITFNRWTVRNGDDGISPKANSTNISVFNSTLIGGSGIALGSIGQFKGVYETIENVTVRDLICEDTLHAAYIKTWTGDQIGLPPNGGGGGLGLINNATFENIQMINGRGAPVSATQCISFSDKAGGCNETAMARRGMRTRVASGHPPDAHEKWAMGAQDRARSGSPASVR